MGFIEGAIEPGMYVNISLNLSNYLSQVNKLLPKILKGSVPFCWNYPLNRNGIISGVWCNNISRPSEGAERFDRGHGVSEFIVHSDT